MAHGSMPTATAIGYDGRLVCALGVRELARSVGFYCDVLGFSVTLRLDDYGWCEVASPLPGVSLGLGEVEKVEPEGGATLTFGVGDIDAARAHLERHDVRFDGDTRDVAGVRLATFYDPDGNALMLSQRTAAMSS